MKPRKARSAHQWQTMKLHSAHLLSRYALNKTNDTAILQDRWFLSGYTDQTSNSSKAAYSQVQTVPSHDAQQAEVTTQAGLSPPPTTANHPDRAKFERNTT
ncbi:TPA: hypothetical protein HIP54_000879 [Escherichia coli]|nr:hypothetical protein [Escherichia coli]